ncbi:MAG TPA: hypothetical protein VG498_26050 [Terriglobales bacterium]|nr:hypothetical protein [Terriglobales bacterium]
MADPLHRDFSDIEPRDTGSVGTEQRGNTMAYPSPLADSIRKSQMNPERQLPEGGNQRLNRAAEQIGTALGKAVWQARHAPETARRGIHLVRERAEGAKSSAADQLSGSAGATQQRAREVADSAQKKARELTDTAQRKAREFMDVAEERGRAWLDKADDVSKRVAQKGNQLRQQLDDRAHELQAEARLRVQEARLRGWRLMQEKPLHVLGGIAGAAFVAGVSLRIVRSRYASRH